MLTRLLYLFPLISAAEHCYLITVARLDDPHFLLAVVAFIRQRTRDLEVHHYPKVLQDQCRCSSSRNDLNVRAWKSGSYVSHRLVNAARAWTSSDGLHSGPSKKSVMGCMYQSITKHHPNCSRRIILQSSRIVSERHPRCH